MPDEPTNSTITWFNSLICSNQMTSTLVDMIKIGQWYGKHAVVSSILEKKKIGLIFNDNGRKLLHLTMSAIGLLSNSERLIKLFSKASNGGLWV